MGEIEKQKYQPDIVNEPMATYGALQMTSPTSIISLVHSFSHTASHIDYLKENTRASDEMIAYWLNVNVKTFRNYKKELSPIKDDIKEQIVMLVALVKHGLSVFGSPHAFGQWLKTKNFLFDGKRPEAFLNTNSGIRFIEDRLTGMEFGDNI